MISTDPIQKLRDQFQSLRRLYFFFMILAILALVVYFIQPWLTLVLLGISLALNLLLGRKKSREYTQAFLHLSAQISLERHLDHAIHTLEPVLEISEIRDSRMLPCNAAHGSILCREGGSGTYHGRQVRLGDVTLAHTFTQGGKKRHNFTVGSWILVKLDRDTGLDCRFIGENTTPEQSLTEMLWVESDLTRTAAPTRANWRILCPEDNTTLPSDAFLKQLDKLHTKADGRVAVCVQGDKLHIMLIGDILGQKVSARMAPGPNFHQADLLPNLSYALMLSDILVR